MGEAAAIHELTQLFDAHHSIFILKRSRLVTWDEAKLKDLIFIGAQSQNPAAGVLPSTTDFTVISFGHRIGRRRGPFRKMQDRLERVCVRNRDLNQPTGKACGRTDSGMEVREILDECGFLCTAMRQWRESQVDEHQSHGFGAGLNLEADGCDGKHAFANF